MRLNAKYKGERDLSDAANERRRFGEAYKPLLARVAGKAILGEGKQVGDNTLTLNWGKASAAADPDAGKPSEKARPNTRPRRRK